MVLWFQEKVDILECHSSFIRSVQKKFSTPAVLKLRYYIQPRKYRRVRLCRENIFLRDKHQCQFCGEYFKAKDLTLDHVMPVSRGGPNSWENLVSACHRCNHKKRNRTPEEAKMPLLQKPKPLKWSPQLDMKIRLQQREEAWLPYLNQYIL